MLRLRMSQELSRQTQNSHDYLAYMHFIVKLNRKSPLYVNCVSLQDLIVSMMVKTIMTITRPSGFTHIADKGFS